MKTSAVHLWKEWREQRATVGILALVLLAGVALLAVVLPRELVRDPLVVQWAVGLALIATVMAIGSDLLARERHGDALAFLERTPRGLASAFRGKLCFFVIAMVAALTYGALLACCAVFARTGEWPRGVVDGAPLWIPAIAVGTSLWLFALSACMPSTALTLPATLLFLAIFAWPAVLAARGGELFRPTTTQAITFFALCAVGAPVSAWASFVVGSRRNGSRARAAFFGACVAAPFFLPSWVWAGMRYAELERAPFDILTAWVGPDQHYAFLDLARRAPNGASSEVASRFDRTSALTLDLAQREWRFSGEIDASGFTEGSNYAHHGRCAYLALRIGESHAGIAAVVDTRTARELPAGDSRLDGVQGPWPADFGLAIDPPNYSIWWSGLGQSIKFADHGAAGVIFRDPARHLVVDQSRLASRHPPDVVCDVRIRPGRWLARDRLDWMFFDPLTGASEVVACIGSKEIVGPSVEDGRVILLGRDGPCILDPDTGRREPIEIVAASVNTVHWIGGPSSMTPPLSIDTPTVVVACEMRWRGIGVLDLCARRLRIVADVQSEAVQLLSSSLTDAITLEGSESIVRYDLNDGRREVLFAASSLR